MSTIERSYVRTLNLFTDIFEVKVNAKYVVHTKEFYSDFYFT